MTPRATLLHAALALFVALACMPASAQQKPPGPPVKPPSWDLVSGINHLCVSRDGTYLVVQTSLGHAVVLPTAGGPEYDLDLEKELGAWYVAITPDSKWVVVCCGLLKSDMTRDDAQPVLAFPPAPGRKRKKLEVKVAEDKPPAKGAAPAVRPEMAKGTVFDVLPLDGSRILLDRFVEDDVVWDVATGTRGDAPPGLGGRDGCDFLEGGSVSVRTWGAGLDLRDPKTNRSTLTLWKPDAPDKDTVRWRPRFASDGSVLVLKRVRDPAAGTAAISLERWTVEDRTKRWEVPLDFKDSKNGSIDLGSASGFAIATWGGELRLLDLRDGKEVPHGLALADISVAKPSADGESVWVGNTEGVVTRVTLPPLPVK